MTHPATTAYLEIILGPMFSGKTSRLVEIYKQCKFCNISVSVINHCIDDRYDNELLSTHDKVKIPCVKTKNLLDLVGRKEKEKEPEKEETNVVLSSDVILINEGQFFTDLYDFVVLALSNGKKIYVCGLDGDFEQKKFGHIIDLIPLCDKVTKLTSLCSICKNGKPGIFSKRITSEKEQTIVGFDNYIPVCRYCYEQ